MRGQVGGALGRIYGDVPLSVSMSVRGDTYTLPGQEDAEHPELTRFAAYTGIEKHARLSEGRWPSAGSGSGAIEAVLPGAAARAMDAGVGDVLTFHGRGDRTSVEKVRIVGLFDVPEPKHHFWQGDTLVTTGVERLDYTTYGPLVVPPEVFGRRFTGTGSEARFTVLPDLRDVGPDELGARADRVAGGEEIFEEAGQGTRFTLVTQLPELTAQLREAVRVARSTMLIPVIQLVLLAGCAWLLVAGLAIWRLNRYGADGAGAREGAAGVDPFIVAGPALALLAGGMLLLRVVPVVSRFAERAATRAAGSCQRSAPGRSGGAGSGTPGPSCCWSWRWLEDGAITEAPVRSM
ncbi:hypothetical protein E1281_21565 [Actinomadura sp. KC345]|uniref:hypothetical protein n=1 Tax=Actinomadura sp. KC345 TaxID=2530371 RepID=UPI001049D5B8|nr:hypothetical protein [Actinomadura sp. KC345]TDC50669.1 hypothetical protein E1281_21565 [Actinomadura sp. KC345]